MKLFHGIFAIVLTAAVVLFALSNRQTVELVLWPLPFAAAAPVYVLALGMFVIGFFCGSLATWLRGLGTRSRVAARKAEPLEREVALLRDRLDVANADTGATGGDGDAAADGAAPPKTIAASRS